VNNSSSVQRGSPDGAANVTPVVSDRSPLIKHATSPPPLIADAVVFDNAAISEPPPMQCTTSAAALRTSGVDRKLRDSPPEVERNVSGGTEATPKRNKKRKVLSIVSQLRSWYITLFTTVGAWLLTLGQWRRHTRYAPPVANSWLRHCFGSCHTL